MYKCKICKEEFNSLNLLSSHIRFKHKLSSYEYSLKYEYNNEIPKCKCGCNQETKWNGIKNGFNDYIRGHVSKSQPKLERFTNRCIICDKEFITTEKDKNYCSRECYLKLNHLNTHEIRKCKICSKEFECSKIDKQQYCSFECSRTDTDLYLKMKNTINEKYGVVNYSKTNEFKEFIKDTSYFKTKEFQLKSKQTKKERYNDENYNNRIKSINSNYKFYFDRLFTSERLKKLVIPLFSLDDYKGVDKEYNFKCVKCNYEFISDLNDGHIPRCPICFPYIKNNSFGENEVYEYIKSILPNEYILKNYNKLLPNGAELDIYIPEYNIAIEFNGLYWHSNKYKNKFYHLWKLNECNKHNINLIQIFENEWIDKQDIVKSIIKNKLKLNNNKIYGRKCIIKKIDNKTVRIFLIENHIQGYVNSNINIGLFYNDELISLMTLGKSRFDKKYEYEIYRFCNKLDYNILGGFNKLLSYFIKNYDPSSIISYVDKRYFIGDLYKYTSFKIVEEYKSLNYWYFKGLKLYNRIDFQYFKLKDKLKIFDENLTEWQNMQLNGYGRIYDCGNFKYIWEK